MLETERTILRPWQESDAGECFEYAKDPRIGPAAGWAPHVSVEDSRRVIREVLAVPETYVIVLKETGLPIGSIGLHFHTDLAEKDDEAELGYWLGVPYWGRGLVPEAAREMLRHAFEDLHLERVWCGYYNGNEKFKRVQEKLGFKYVRTCENVPVPQLGETRVGISNLLTREEWESSGKDDNNEKGSCLQQETMKDIRLNGQERFLSNVTLYRVVFPDFWKKAYAEKNPFYQGIYEHGHMFVELMHEGEEYLEGEKIQQFWHQHCDFCMEKAETSKECVFYTTKDMKHWICSQCFEDFRERFNWNVLPSDEIFD